VKPGSLGEKWGRGDPNTRANDNPGWKWEIAAGLVAAFLYAGSLRFGWVYDDQMEVVLNPLIRSLANLQEIFSTTAWAGSGMETYLYRPLTTLSFLLNHLISGPDPWSFHLTNVLLHAVISVLVVRLGRMWGLSARAAGIAGLLFAIHPVHVEVVAAVFGRKDLLATLFTLLMILSHGRALERVGWRSVLPPAAFALALLSKESGMAALPLLAAQEWILEPNRKSLFSNPGRARLYAAYLGIFLAYVLVRNGVTGGVAVPDTYYMDNPLAVAALPIRAATALIVLGKGLCLLVAPVTLSPDYSFNAIPLVRTLLDWRLLAALAGGALLAGALVIPRVRASVIPLGIAWYLLAVLPAANLLIPVGTIFGERLLYLPSVAFCLLVGWLAAQAFERVPVPATVVAAGIMGVLALQTIRYTEAWKSDLTLFTWAVESVPNSTKAHHKLGEEYLRAGELGPALRHLRRALEIAPDNEFAVVTLALAKRAVEERYSDTTWPPAPGSALPTDPDVLYVLGQLSQERGDLDSAKGYWEEALHQDPGHGEALGDLGALYLLRGDTATALRYLQEAVASSPGMARAWYNLARVRLARGDSATGRIALESFLASARGRYPRQVEWAMRMLAELGGA
jgi:tetratricopeptide (TPR) repeat protein